MYFLDFFSKGSERTKLLKTNVIFSFFLQGISIMCAYILVPLTLNYLNTEEYGVWLTLSSIVTWINVCDIGIGMGLKNKLGEALAVKNYKLGKAYVSVTYAILSIIISVFLLLFLIINCFLDWGRILNVNSASSESLSIVVVVVVSFFCTGFVVKTIGIVLTADQRGSINSMMSVIGSLISLLLIYIQTKLVNPSLLNVASVFCSTPVFISIIGSIFLYKTRYKAIRPSFHYVDFKYAKELIGLSAGFFILNVSGIIVFTTSNFVITQSLGPHEVTVYNVCFKYFNIVTMMFNLILAPMWPAYTNAYALGDMQWIKKSIKKLILLWLLLSLLTFIMFLISSFVYNIWIGDTISIPIELSAVMAVYVIIGNWNNIFAQMLAGVGKIRMSIWNSAINGVIFIPFSYYLCNTMGLMGISISMILTIITSTFWQPIQSYRIIKGTATGIWNK